MKIYRLLYAAAAAAAAAVVGPAFFSLCCLPNLLPDRNGLGCLLFPNQSAGSHARELLVWSGRQFIFPLREEGREEGVQLKNQATAADAEKDELLLRSRR
jgi:hypothetical protein